MFIEQSAGRIRFLRTLFVLAGILPCALLVGFAVWRHSARHVEAVERECEALLGMPLEVGGVRHLRPGAMRLEAVALLAATGEPILALPALDVEVSATEVRLAAQRLECTPRVVAALAELGGAWLDEPERFTKAWVVDVAEVVWPAEPGAAAMRPSGIHAEGALAADARAVRVRREPQGRDEIRVQSSPRVGAADAAGGRRIELHAVIDEPLPVALVAAMAGLPSAAAGAAGPAAVVQGSMAAVHEAGRWSGALSGALGRIDLASLTARAMHRMTGEADLEVTALDFAHGRLVTGEANLSAVAGRVPQDFLNAVVNVLGCRTGPAFRSLAAEVVRGYDDVACRVRIDGRGLAIRAPGDRAGAVMRFQGLALLEEPAEPVPAERLAWLLAPPGRVPVPASDATAWLISRLPNSAVAPASGAVGGRVVPPRAERPGRREEF
ncbi:MAG: hypothetical protein ACKOHG_09850 [Planctomycetia bacterium]